MEDRAFTDAALGPDRPAMELDDLANDRKAEARALLEEACAIGKTPLVRLVPPSLERGQPGRACLNALWHEPGGPSTRCPPPRGVPE